MRYLVTAITLGIAFVSAPSARAQAPFNLELRTGAAFPTADFGESTLNTGIGGGITVGWAVMPHAGVYAGWDWFRFTTATPYAGRDYDVENTGYVLGGQFYHLINEKVGYWARAGGLYAHVELENDGGGAVTDSGHEFGWEAGAGASIAVGRVLLIPGFRYRNLRIDVEDGDTNETIDLSYLTAELGVRFEFGGKGAASLKR